MTFLYYRGEIMKYTIYTLGCKVNTFESESVSSILSKNGYSRVDNDEVADLYIINTCTVTNKSDSKSRKVIRGAIKKNPEAIVVVMGCYAQLAKDDIVAIDGVDIILGNDDKDKIYEIVEQYKKDNKQQVLVSDIMKSKVMSDLATDTFYENTRAFLKVQDGCNNFCSYCIIPYARGGVRSKPKEQVLKEVKELVENGYLEVVLTGIHTGGYGQETGEYNISDLVEDILKIPNLARLRISSIEISEIDEKLISILTTSPKLAKHLHIPIQSGSNDVLVSMRRKYTTAEFIAKVKQLKSMIDNLSVTTDIIVGYPTETDELFEESLETCKAVEFSELHVFPYSKRNGTPAAKLKQVSDTTKKERSERLLALSDELKAAFYKNNIGLVDSIIVENVNDEYVLGKTSNYLSVKVYANGYNVGDIINIKVTDVENEYCVGEING